MLRESKGNMYDFVTHTWNPIKGKCPHDCSYCYMKRWGEQKPLRLDEKEMKTDLGSGNFIFVGSSTDIFAKEVNIDWKIDVINYCNTFPENKYLLQTKNPIGLHDGRLFIKENYVLCTTIESNRQYYDIRSFAPSPWYRAYSMSLFTDNKKYVTIEPIIDFDLDEMVELIKMCNPVQVNIGADSGRNNLPEPSRDKLIGLISQLQEFTTIHKKSNLERLLRS